MEENNQEKASYWTGDGRINRINYFIFYKLMSLFFYFIAGLLIGSVEFLPIIGGVLFLVGLYIIIMGSIKRLHDINLPGHLVWIGLSPYILGMFGASVSKGFIIGAVVISVLFSLFLIFYPGTKGVNKYGDINKLD